MKSKEEILEKHFGISYYYKHEYLRDDIFKSMDEYAYEMLDEQKLNLSGIGSKRPTENSIDWKSLRQRFFKECTTETPRENEMKKVNVAPHDLFEWFKAACASGGEGTVAEGAGREIKDYRIEQPTEDGVIGTEFGFTEHNGE